MKKVALSAIIGIICSISAPALAGRYDGIADLAKRFNHVSPPPVWKQMDNPYGGKTTITNKPTTDPSYPGQRFESFQVKDGNGNLLGKDTWIYDHNGKINAVK